MSATPRSPVTWMDVFILALVDGREARYLETGHLLYLRSGTLYAAPFDPVRVEMAGEGVPVRDRIRTGNVNARTTAISETGSSFMRGHCPPTGN